MTTRGLVRSRRTWAIAMAVTLLLVSGCGSTATQPTNVALGGGPSGSQSDPDLATTDEFGADADDAPSTSAGGGPRPTSPGAGTPTSPSTPDGQTPPPPGGGGGDTRVAGRGITNEKITIGIGWTDVTAAVQVLAPQAQGEQGYKGSTKDVAGAVVEWINSHGGIAGRQIEPIYHEYPISEVVTVSSRHTREQAMCADWTEDHQAFAALPQWPMEGVYWQCAAENNLISLGWVNGSAPVDQTRLAEIGNVWYSPAAFAVDRREQMLVEQLGQSGFFSSGAKVGLLLWDSPPTRRAAERVFDPALKALGVQVVAREFYNDIPHDWSNVVLRFQTAGVTHVVWGGSPCDICPAGFWTTAENQGYRPFNAISTDQSFDGASKLAPAAQRERIMGIGWSPMDGGPSEYEGAAPLNAVDAECRQIKEQSGIDQFQTFFAKYCDGLFFLKMGLEAAPSLTVEGFRQAVETPGFGFPGVGAWAASFGPGRHDGANAVRELRYDRACACYRFTGPIRQLG